MKGTGEQVWRHVLFADGGYCVVNWNDPFRVILFANGRVFRATDGGLDYPSWANVTPTGATWQVMAEPLVGAPRNPAAPAEADIVALGVGNRIFISSDFGTSGPDQPMLPAGSGAAFSMAFASATRLFVGTTKGRVFRLDDGGPGGWTVTRKDNAVAGPLPIGRTCPSDIAIDTSDATRRSIYICFGGVGDFRHVWRFDGTSAPRGAGRQAAVTAARRRARAISSTEPPTASMSAPTSGFGRPPTAVPLGHPSRTACPSPGVRPPDPSDGPTAARLAARPRGVRVEARCPGSPTWSCTYTTRCSTPAAATTPTAARSSGAPSIPSPLPQPEHQGRRSHAGRLPDSDHRHRLPHLQREVVRQQRSRHDQPAPTVHNRVYVQVHNRGRFDAPTCR